MITHVNLPFAPLRSAVTDIRGNTCDLAGIFGEFRTLINSFALEFTSEISDTICSEIAGIQPKFDGYMEVIESYTQFLDRTIEEYAQVEADLCAKACQFI